MSTKLTFNIDLTEYDISKYEKNPIVLLNFNYTIPPIGKATIAPDRKSVEVELADSIYPVAKAVKEKYKHFYLAMVLK